MKPLCLVLLGYLLSQACGQSEGDLRLNTGTSSFFSSTGGSAGRLEIYYNFQWGTVCDDFFGSSDAAVACGQLGYSYAVSYTSTSFSNTLSSFSSVPIWLDDVSCTGSESRLELCSSRGFGNHNCVHSEDVELVCSNINFVGLGIGVTVGVIVLIIVSVICCILCCVCCIAKSSSSPKTVRVAQPTTTNVVYTTTTQATTAYPVSQQTYTSTPQQAPAAYPAQPTNPELQAGAPPAYNEFSAYPPAQNPGYPAQGAQYPSDPGYPAQQGAPYPPTDPGYPPQGAPYPSDPAYPPQGY